MDIKLTYGDSITVDEEQTFPAMDSLYVEVATKGGRFGGRNVELYSFIFEDGTIRLAVRLLDDRTGYHVDCPFSGAWRLGRDFTLRPVSEDELETTDGLWGLDVAARRKEVSNAPAPAP